MKTVLLVGDGLGIRLGSDASATFSCHRYDSGQEAPQCPTLMLGDDKLAAPMKAFPGNSTSAHHLTPLLTKSA